MRRLKNDRGAAAIVVALMMAPILACAALVIDVGAAYVLKAQLQTAADAGALAIAQDCASGRQRPCSKTTSEQTAKILADPAISGEVTVAVTPDPPVDSVTVIASSRVDYLFAPIIGVEGNTLFASAVAVWGAPISGSSVLPIAFHECAFNIQTGGFVPSATSVPIQFEKTDGISCGSAKNNVVPGGFGWVDVEDRANCIVKSTAVPGAALNRLSSSTGAGHLPCDRSFFDRQVGHTVLLPVFKNFGGSGNHAWYDVYAYAAFELTAVNFQGSKNSIEGRFVVFVERSELFTFGAAPNMYAQVVKLVG